MAEKEDKKLSELLDFLLSKENRTQIPLIGGRASTIRASEIGSFLYCNRAWWYHRQGVKSENVAELMAGTELHEQHGRTVITAGLFRSLGYFLLLAAIILFTIYGTTLLFP